MATSTARLQLHKPDPPENVNVVQDLNNNYDKLDDDAGLRVVTSGTRPASPYTGQVIYETDTFRKKFWNGTIWVDLTPFVVRKTGTETINNSDVFQDDNQLFFNVAVNARYKFEVCLRYRAHGSADFKARFNGPGLTGNATVLRLSQTAAGVDDVQLVSDDLQWFNIGGIGTATDAAFLANGILLTDATSNLATIQWAQSVAHASDASVQVNSYIKVTQFEE